MASITGFTVHFWYSPNPRQLSELSFAQSYMIILIAGLQTATTLIVTGYHRD